MGRYALIHCVSPMSVDHRHASPVHGVNKAVDIGHWNRGPYPEKSYIQICCSYRPWSHFIELSLDFVPQIVLLEKVPGGSGSVGAGIVLLEHVILVAAKIGHNVKSKDLIGIPQSRDAIPSTWANILKGNRSSFMTDPDGFPYHDALPTR